MREGRRRTDGAVQDPVAERLRRALCDAAEAFVELIRNTHPERADAEPDGPPLLLSVRDAAARLGISVTALRRFERAGSIASVRVGRRLLFHRDAVRRFVTEHEHFPDDALTTTPGPREKGRA